MAQLQFLDPPGQDRPVVSRDHAPKGFSLAALEELVGDCAGQPAWRPRADMAHAYYDMGKQLKPERAEQIRREMGIAPRQTNLIHGVINGILGSEARARTDIRVEADTDEFEDVAAVLGQAMKEAQRESSADMAISNAYASQVKGGIGWVEVSRSSDPVDYPYRVTDVHRNEIWFDWRSKHLGLQDARWLVRKRWIDLDEAVAMLPKFEDILTQAVNGWDLLHLPDDGNSAIVSAYNAERRTTIQRDEWCDSSRKRLKLFEIWYRVPAEVVVLQLTPTRRVIFDETNPLHQAVLERGMAPITKAVTRQVRAALFAGPHRLMDVGTTRRSFPYVPFIAYRDDEDRSPYGLIEGMISPQDEYNERRQMVNWMLKARQILIDDDALNEKFNSIADIAADAARPDMVAVLNSARRNANGLVVKNELRLQPEQLEVMQDAKLMIQEVPRIYNSQLGAAPAGVTSGLANSLLIEQGVIAMGELNDNYRYARRFVHDQLLELICEDHSQAELQAVIGNGTARRVVVLNAWSPEGLPQNMVKDAPIRVGLSDVPASPAFRMQEQQQLAQIIQAIGSNPQAMAVLAPAYIEGTSLPNRQAIADDLRRATGQPLASDKQAQAQAQQQQLAQREEQAQATKSGQELMLRGAAAEIDHKEAMVAKLLADAERARALAARETAQARAIDAMPIQAGEEAADHDRVIADALQEAMTY
jgi:hypothetical protein